jgi:AI-2 transport system permease protein
VSILGGIGTAIGSTLGAILLRTINASMLFAGISQYWLGAVQGILILLTVLLDLLRRRRQKYLK